MQETVTIPLSSHTLNLIKTAPSGAAEALYEELQTRKEQIRQLLLAYHFAAKERVFEVKIEPFSVSVNRNGEGSFSVSYRINVFNGCADLDLSSTKNMRIEARINFETATVNLSGELIRERDPDEF